MTCADFPGDADDTRIGFRMSSALGADANDIFSRRKEYACLPLARRDGVDSGISFTREGQASRIPGYLCPSTGLDTGNGRISDQALSAIPLDAQGNNDGNGTCGTAGVGLLVLVTAGMKS